MTEETVRLLNLRRLPARLKPEQAAPVLGFEPHDLPILVRAGLLIPLGKPTANSVKYFAACEIERCAKDINWLNKATKKIGEYWASHNKKRQALKPGVIETQLAA